MTTYQDSTYIVNLERDQGQTFFLSTFAHDPFHDMYFAHGTGKLRYTNFFNDRAGNVASAPGLGLYKSGGGPEEASDEINRETDLKLALKMGLTTIPQNVHNIFIGIGGRSEPTWCAQDSNFSIYIDLNMLSLDYYLFSPGYITIGEDVLSPYDLVRVENIPIGDAGVNEHSFEIRNGTYAGYVIRTIQPSSTTNEGDKEIYVYDLKSEFIVLKRLSIYPQCVSPPLSVTIVTVMERVIEQYKQRPELEMSFEEFVETRTDDTELMMARNSVFYFLCAKTGILNVDIAINNTGDDTQFQYLFRQLCTNPVIMEARMGLGSAKNIQKEIEVFLKALAGGYITMPDSKKPTQTFFNLGGNWQPWALETKYITMNADGTTWTLTENALQFPILNQLANNNRQLYSGDILSADTSFLPILSTMCVKYNIIPIDNILEYRIQIGKSYSEMQESTQTINIKNFVYILCGELLETYFENGINGQGGGAPTVIGTMFDESRASSAVESVQNALYDRSDERRKVGVEQALIEAWTPIMKGSIGDYLLPYISSKNYSRIIQAPVTYVGSSTDYVVKIEGFTRMFPPPTSTSFNMRFPTLENVQKNKRYLLRTETENFKALTSKLNPAIFNTVEILQEPLLSEVDLPIPLSKISKRNATYNQLETLFENISTLLNFLFIISDLSNRMNVNPIYFFSRQEDWVNWITGMERLFQQAIPIFEKITQLKGKKLAVTALGRLNNGYVLGSVAAIVCHCMEHAPTSNKAKMLFQVEKDMINALLVKGVTGVYDRLLNNQTPPNDTKLVTSIINMSNFYARKAGAKLITKWPATVMPGVNVSLFNDLESEGWGGIINTMQASVADPNGPRFTVNNAVTIAADRLDVSKKHFCDTSSVIDAMTSICNNIKVSLPSGIEWGIMDVSVQSDMFFYRVRVTPNQRKGFKTKENVPSWVDISAYLKVIVFDADGTSREVVLINVYKVADPKDAPTDWPQEDKHDGYSVNLESSDLGPLSARASVENLQYFIDALPIIPGKTDTYENLIKTLHTAPGDEILANQIDQTTMRSPSGVDIQFSPIPRWEEFFPSPGENYTVDYLRRGIIEHSFRKSLGDYLQEMTTVVSHGGYINPGPKFSESSNILPPNEGRLGLHNDRPAAARAIILTLFGDGAVNPKTISGLVVTDKQNRLNYVVAGRGVSGGGGGRLGRVRRKRRTRKTRKIKKHKKSTKRKVIKKQRKSIHRKRKKRKSKNRRIKH